LAVIQALIVNCADTSLWIENVGRRKNAAMAFYKLKKFDECLSVLAPLREDAAKTNETIKEEFMPIEAGLYIDILKTTRQHLKLCAPKK
jgi:hypothetical protein